MLKRLLLALAVLVAGALLVTDFVQAQPRERSGEEVVKQQCSKCHATGVDGAPKIDDRAAWAPRMKQGVNATLRSAIRGHGKMPARGGLADLTDNELRAAILYMFYPAGASLKPRDTTAAPADPNHRSFGGIDFYLGVTAASIAPVGQPGPKSRGYYYVNISLHDAGSKAFIKDAQVEARAANPVTGGETKKLELVKLNDTASYGNYFRMEGPEPYTITVRARRPGEAKPIEAQFEFKP